MTNESEAAFMASLFMASLNDAFMDALFYRSKAGKWTKACRSKKGKRAKSGQWWNRAIPPERPVRELRDQNREFNGISPSYTRTDR